MYTGRNAQAWPHAEPRALLVFPGPAVPMALLVTVSWHKLVGPRPQLPAPSEEQPWDAAPRALLPEASPFEETDLHALPRAPLAGPAPGSGA